MTPIAMPALAPLERPEEAESDDEEEPEVEAAETAFGESGSDVCVAVPAAPGRVDTPCVEWPLCIDAPAVAVFVPPAASAVVAKAYLVAAPFVFVIVNAPPVMALSGLLESLTTI